jgi:hypothetical protein
MKLTEGLNCPVCSQIFSTDVTNFGNNNRSLLPINACGKCGVTTCFSCIVRGKTSESSALIPCPYCKAPEAYDESNLKADEDQLALIRLIGRIQLRLNRNFFEQVDTDDATFSSLDPHEAPPPTGPNTCKRHEDLFPSNPSKKKQKKQKTATPSLGSFAMAQKNITEGTAEPMSLRRSNRERKQTQRFSDSNLLSQHAEVEEGVYYPPSPYEMGIRVRKVSFCLRDVFNSKTVSCSFLHSLLR